MNGLFNYFNMIGGMMSFGVPIYLSEIAPTAIRGRITTLFQLLVTVGIFVITMTAFFLIEHLGYSIESIRYLFYLVFSGGVLMSVTSVVLPASPHWLIYKGKTMIAHEVFKQMGFTSSEIDQEFKIEKLPSFNYFQQCAYFFKNGSLLLLALLGSSLFLLQQLGNTGLFWSMSGFCLIGLIIVAVYLKETAKIALASIYNEVDAHTMR